MVISEWPNRPPQSVELLGPIVVENSKKKKWKHQFALTQEEARKLQQEKDQVVQRQRADEDLDAIFSLDEQDRKRPADEIPPPPPYVPPPEEPSVPKAEVRQGRGFAMNVIEELGDDKVPMAENRPRKFRMGLLSGDSDRETKRPRKENPPPPPPPQRGDKPPPPPPRGVPPAFESSPAADGIEAPPPPPLPSVNL